MQSYPPPDPSDPCRPHRLIARQNALANLRLANACAALQAGEWAAPRTGFFPSLCATLNQLFGVDHFYIDALHGGRLGTAAFADPVPYPALDDLRAAQAALDLRLVAFCDSLEAADMTRIVQGHRDDHIQHEVLPELLLHIALHAVHHRGQAHAMLSSTSVAPPQIDEFICRGEGPLRAAEMAELRWSEAYLAS